MKALLLFLLKAWRDGGSNWLKPTYSYKFTTVEMFLQKLTNVSMQDS